MNLQSWSSTPPPNWTFSTFPEFTILRVSCALRERISSPARLRSFSVCVCVWPWPREWLVWLTVPTYTGSRCALGPGLPYTRRLNQWHVWIRWRHIVYVRRHGNGMARSQSPPCSGDVIDDFTHRQPMAAASALHVDLLCTAAKYSAFDMSGASAADYCSLWYWKKIERCSSIASLYIKIDKNNLLKSQEF